MGLFVKQNEERSELQQKIAADMTERLRARAETDETPPDHVEDSKFMEGTSHMTRTGIILIIVLVVAAATVIILATVR